MNTLNFNDADLKANREGRLSDAQAKRLDTDADQIQWQSKMILWVCVGVFSLITMAIIINTYTHVGQDLGILLSRMTSIGFVAIAAVFITIFIGMVFVHEWNTNSFAHEPIRMIQGTAEVVRTHTTTRDGKKVPVYKLILHSNWYTWLEFSFNDEASLLYFESGRRYRVYYLIYYLPWARPQALSAEEIKPEKAKR